MNRRNFLTKAAVSAVSAKLMFSSAAWAMDKDYREIAKRVVDLSEIPPMHPNITKGFSDLLQVMNSAPWKTLIKAVSGTDLPVDDPLHPSFFKIVQMNLAANEGCDDFAGNKLIEPGYPALSLLYHLAASPRVVLPGDNSSTSYLTLEQIDQLENFIYAAKAIAPAELKPGKMVLAVFAYEYRPACKTPHECHADMVFARTGFARIGTQPMAEYDRVNRCFTNRPDETSKAKEIAVTPARYGLFLAEMVPFSGVERNNPIKQDQTDHLQFLLPVRKIFSDDIYLGDRQLFFSESHINEKLRKLCLAQGIDLPTAGYFDINKKPFFKVSCSSTQPDKKFAGEHETDMVQLIPKGSSVLLTSVHTEKLIRPAEQDLNGKQRVRINIEEKKGQGFLHSNRRYTSLKVPGSMEQIKDLLDIIKAKLLHANSEFVYYHVYRNAPMFVYIRDRVHPETGKSGQYLSPETDHLQDEVNKSYCAGLFEDNICDGCIFPEIIAGSNLAGDPGPYDKISKQLMGLPLLPAFSIVTAPDFFPIVESYDMKPYKDLFFVGGVQDMGGARERANPAIMLPGSGSYAFPEISSGIREDVERTVIALISAKRKDGADPLPAAKSFAAADQLMRSNFLPDCATKIFYPGWDITYSGGTDKTGTDHGTFYATYGLGSPFAEDSKLCAAVNGMWAAASPDSARTFRNTLTKLPRGLKMVFPPTAVPLLDADLGYHADSPAVQNGKMKSTGWDGEQGPFLIKQNGKVYVNYTDIGRADYIMNAIEGKFDMSVLREIRTADIKYRMQAMQRCLDRLGKKNTDLWLVGAEKVDWRNEEERGFCIPANLYGNDRKWATNKKLTYTGRGFIYLFTETKPKSSENFSGKRLEQECNALYLFQVNETEIVYCTLNESTGWKPFWTS